MDELRDIVPAAPIIVVGTQTKCVAGMRTECCEFHNSVLSAYRIRRIRFLLTSPILSPRVAGPERTFFCREPATWRGDLMRTALFDDV
jgi:hypothetical protein